MRIALLIALFAVSLLTGCGGGGSSVARPAGVDGQVVKGPTRGATVSLYSLTDSGQRTLITSAVTDASGAFRLPYALQSGRVYLLEAEGGQYINEISNATESLASPMRAVFVASGTETRFVISAISEAVALEVERSSAPDKWSASSVASATTLVNAAFGLPSPFDLRLIDLNSYVPGSDPGVTNADLAFSLHLGSFAGFLHELRLRNAGLTFADALSSYHGFVLGSTQDETLLSVWTAGLMRFIERVPSLALRKASIYMSLGLTGDATADQFNGAESSGRSLVSVPDWTLRLLSPPSWSSHPTTDTVFNSRGALEAYRRGSADSGLGFAHVGYASVADVYGTAETAIGRWNRGYYFPQGFAYDTGSQQFVRSNAMASALSPDFVYAAGMPATALPACGLTLMAPQAQTKAYTVYDGSRTLTLDASSRIGFQYANGTTFVGYSIVLRDQLNNVYTFTSVGGANAPWQGSAVEINREFGSSYLLPLPSGDSLQFRGLLAGVGGTKAVINISSNIQSSHSGGLAAAFEQTGSFQSCALPTYASGSVSPLPATGDYYMSWMGRSYYLSGLTFFANGTPNPISASGLSENSGVEKSGNDVAGIGVMLPGYTYQGAVSPVPRAYSYLQTAANPVVPKTGSGSYRLVASTPLLIMSADQLISADAGIQSASLTIQFDQYPLGTPSANYGTCQLTINGQLVQTAGGRYSQYAGSCNGSSGVSGYGESLDGGITSGDNRYAVILYTKYYSPYVKGEAALLFEKNP